MKSEIILMQDGRLKAFVHNAKACDLINRRLRQYKDAQFELEGSEGIFFFTEEERPFVEACIASQEK